DNRNVALRGRRSVQSQNLMGRHQPHLHIQQSEMLPSLHRFDLVPGKLKSSVDPSQGESIGLASDFDQQSPDQREREWQFQLKACSLTSAGRNTYASTQFLDRRLHYIEPHAAPGDFRNGFLHRKSRQEEKLEQF